MIQNNKYLIKSNGGDGVHQSQPNAIIKFYSFAHRDTVYNTDLPAGLTKPDVLKVNEYVVNEDILTVNLSSSKGSNIGTAEVVLASGQYNYLSLLGEGDHVLIWLFDNDKKFTEMKKKITNNEKSNDFNSGLKFVGKVNSIRKIYNVAPNGVKTLRYLLTLKSFSEFNAQIYYNKFLDNPQNSANDTNEALRVFQLLSDRWGAILPKPGQLTSNIGQIVQFFVTVFLGTGPKRSFQSTGTNEVNKAAIRSPNTAFLVPDRVGQILGLKKTGKNFTYADILKEYIGRQSYTTNNNNMTPALYALIGDTVPNPDTFNNVSLWSLIMAYINPTLNEAYNTLRVDENTDILPSFIARQIPFTSDQLLKKNKKLTRVTPFRTLPIWQLDDSRMIGSFNIGTSDAVRCNFFQIYGSYYGASDQQPANYIQQQINKGNLKIDVTDIARHGPRNQIKQIPVDFKTDKGNYTVNLMTEITSDFYLNAHLKLNGSVSITGVSEPIAIGDNLQFDGCLLHIEALQHSYVNDEMSGSRSFITNLQLSNGVNIDGSYTSVTEPLRDQLENKKSAPGYTNVKANESQTNALSDLSNESLQNKISKLRKLV